MTMPTIRSLWALMGLAVLAGCGRPAPTAKPARGAPITGEVARAQPAAAAVAPARPEVGSPAPGFTLDQFDGGQVTLAQHQGKSVVLLDFWASWCGPCRMSLPVLAEVAAAFREKGVILYAVNQREDHKKIAAFLQSSGLKLNVLMDRRSEVGQAYGVRGIPHCVVVGRDGVVKAVHVGYSPLLKEELTREVSAALAGPELSSPR